MCAAGAKTCEGHACMSGVKWVFGVRECMHAWSAKSGEEESGRKSVGCQQALTSFRMGRTDDSMYLSMERSRSSWCAEMLCNVCTATRSFVSTPVIAYSAIAGADMQRRTCFDMLEGP